MLAHTNGLMEHNNGYVGINPKYNILVTALRTAVENGKGSLDKQATSHDTSLILSVIVNVAAGIAAL